jgi:protein gp37
MDERMLIQPLQWRRSKWIFVCSQTDLFGDFVTDEMIDRVFAVMLLSSHHRFQVLTKRAARMRKYFANLSNRQEAVGVEAERIHNADRSYGEGFMRPSSWQLPLPNIIMGVSVEDGKHLDRIVSLTDTPATVRFASLEPLLEDLGDIRGSLMRHCAKCGAASKRGRARCLAVPCDGQLRGGLDWVIVGGESGPGARPCNLPWVRSIRDQCVELNVPFFFKQWGEWTPREDVPLRGRRVIKIRDGMVRVGRKEAGRLLDGETWGEMPEL